ncbi:MAG: hypothetical protein ABMA13_05120 [Chthoniobacteraceae bacterium]
MPDHPLDECSVEADVVSGSLAFKPFVAQDLVPLAEQLAVEARAIIELDFVVDHGACAFKV